MAEAVLLQQPARHRKVEDIPPDFPYLPSNFSHSLTRDSLIRGFRLFERNSTYTEMVGPMKMEWEDCPETIGWFYSIASILR